MITIINLRLSAGHVNLPLPVSAVIAGSAATFVIEGVPSRKLGVNITTVAVVVTNPAGVRLSTTATAMAGQWVATVPATHFANGGSVHDGVSVECSGTDEANASRTWTLGMGDLRVIPANLTTVDLGELRSVNYRATVPTNPVQGDLAKHGSIWKLYNGTAWETLGGAGGAVEWDDVQNKPLGEANGVATLNEYGELSEGQRPKFPGPIDPADATNDGQYADALAVKNELAGKADTATTYTKTEVDTALSAKATIRQLSYTSSGSSIGHRIVAVVESEGEMEATLPAIPNTDEVLNCDIVVNGTAATADFGLTLVGGTGVNVYYPNGEGITCKSGCVTMVSCVGINGLGWLVVGCNNLKTAS